MPIMDGVRIGPMDPDSTADFGTVGAKNSARTLVRRHAAMHPPQLMGAISRPQQLERSKVLDLGEVRAAAEGRIEDDGQEVPEGFYITGANVRGEDDHPSLQVVSFTYALPSGRQGKGCLPYNADTLPGSVAAGDEAVRIKDLKDRGLPYIPQQVSDALERSRVKGEAGEFDDADSSIDLTIAKDAQAAAEKERDEANDRAKRAEAERDEDRRRLEALEATVAQLTQGGQPGPSTTDPDAGRPPLPFEDFEGMNADKLKERLAGASDEERVGLAQSVLAFEQGPDGSNRSTVVKAAQQILDHSAGAA